MYNNMIDTMFSLNNKYPYKRNNNNQMASFIEEPSHKKIT